MLCGTRDLLQPACDALFERADAADWPMEYVVAPGLIHVYPLCPIPEARAAMDHIVRFLHYTAEPSCEHFGDSAAARRLVVHTNGLSAFCMECAERAILHRNGRHRRGRDRRRGRRTHLRTGVGGVRISVRVLERSARVGGRVGTDVIDGFRCDRGFQWLNAGNPDVRGPWTSPR